MSPYQRALSDMFDAAETTAEAIVIDRIIGHHTPLFTGLTAGIDGAAAVRIAQ